MNRPGLHAIATDHVFDGTNVREHAAVIVDGARIVDVVPMTELAMTIPMLTLPDGAWLAPGFIDVQVNGGGDVLFNDDPTPGAIDRIVAAHRSFGTTGLLPTLITDTPAKMRAALSAVRQACAGNAGVLGIHLEGPFLAPEKPGVHDAALFRVPEAKDAAELIEARAGVMLVTLAPELPAHTCARSPPGASTTTSS